MKRKWLTRREDRTWRGYMRMRTLLDLQIGRDLANDSDLSSADYQVLATLSETRGRRLRLIELAQRMHWSKSRLGHQLDRMAARDLVERQSHPTNSRAVVIALTEHGLDTIRAAAADHAASIRRHFLDLLSAEQIEALGDATKKVIHHLSSYAESESVSVRRQTPSNGDTDG